MNNKIDLLAEKSLIGCLLVDNDSILDISEFRLTPDDFFSTTNKIIFEVIQNLHKEKSPCDYTILRSKLIDNGKIYNLTDGDLKGESCITNLFDSTVSSAYIKQYAKIVREKSNLRKLLSVAENTIKNCDQQNESTSEIIEKSIKSLIEISQQEKINKSSSFYELLSETLDDIANSNDKSVRGISTGFKTLDSKLLGLKEGRMYVIAARPSMGKTSFALNLALNAYKTLDKKVPIIIFSTEMTKQQISTRIMIQQTRIPCEKIDEGNLSIEDLEKIKKYVAENKESRLFFYDDVPLTANDIKAECRRIKNKYGQIGMIVVDYLQLMKSENKENREQQIAGISRDLKILSKEMECPLLALSQVNRAIEMNIGNKRPTLSHLRESGAIEQDADVVMMLYRDEYYEPETTKEKGIAEIIIVKNRFGKCGTVKTKFEGETTNFLPIEIEYEDLEKKQNRYKKQTKSEELFDDK